MITPLWICGASESNSWNKVYFLGELTILPRVQTYLAIIVASIPFIKPLFRDSKTFSLTFYRSLLGKQLFNRQNWRERSGFRSPKREGYATQKDDSSCVSPVPLVPRDDFIVTMPPNARIDHFNRNDYLRAALAFSPA